MTDDKKLTPEQAKEQLLEKYSLKLNRILFSVGDQYDFTKKFSYDNVNSNMTFIFNDPGRGQYEHLEDALCDHGLLISEASKVPKIADSEIYETGKYSGDEKHLSFEVNLDNTATYFEAINIKTSAQPQGKEFTEEEFKSIIESTKNLYGAIAAYQNACGEDDGVTMRRGNGETDY